MRRSLSSLALALAVTVGCHKSSNDQPTVQTATIGTRDITVTAQATGTVEPIDTVEVKSQASGMIVAMPVDIGSQVKPGNLIAQIDTTNLRYTYDRAVAAQRAAVSTLTVDSAALARAKTLYAQKVITADEYEAALVAEANARSSLISTQTDLKTAQQNLGYATVTAEVAGTVISKSAAVGTVVASATSTYGGGSTILTVADLTKVRMLALVNETDVGNVHVGMPVTVTVDAFPNRQFAGVVEKVEPQATVQNSVTMFPVQVSLGTVNESLLPGMNGEVVIVTQQRTNVLAVPNDAVSSQKDVTTTAAALGVNMDSLRKARQARGGGSTSVHRNGGAGGSSAQSGSGTSSAGAGGAGGAGAAGGSGSGSGAQIVFVKQGTTWVPRRVRLGVSDFDFSEVLSGLKAGDQVALLGTVTLQAQRDQRSDRVRAMTGGGLPGTGSSSSTPAAGAGGGGGARGGSGGGGGGGGGGAGGGSR